MVIVLALAIAIWIALQVTFEDAERQLLSNLQIKLPNVR